MKKLLAQLVGLNGVNHAAIYSAERGIFSTLPKERQAGIADAGILFEQIFGTLRLIGKDHNEAYVEFNKGMMMAYEVPNLAVLLLLTDKKVNFPMLGMGIKSASKRLETLLANSTAHSYPGQIASGTPQKSSSAPNRFTVKTEKLSEAVASLIRDLEELLIDFTGPAATLVLKDCMETWKANYSPQPETIGHLIELLSNELETDDEKQQFKQQAHQIKP